MITQPVVENKWYLGRLVAMMKRWKIRIQQTQSKMYKANQMVDIIQEVKHSRRIAQVSLRSNKRASKRSMKKVNKSMYLKAWRK